MKSSFRLAVLILLLSTLGLLLSACAAPGAETEGAGQLAFVDSVEISERDGGSYATAIGNFPNGCARVSDVQQTVEGSAITIQLYVDQPADLICTQALVPFALDILLQTGGLAPGDYTVTVNERSTTLTLSG